MNKLGRVAICAKLLLDAFFLPGCGPKINEGDCLTPKGSDKQAYTALATQFYGKPTPTGTVPEGLHCTTGRQGYVGRQETVELKNCAVVNEDGQLVEGTFWGFQKDFDSCNP